MRRARRAAWPGGRRPRSWASAVSPGRASGRAFDPSRGPRRPYRRTFDLPRPCPAEGRPRGSGPPRIAACSTFRGFIYPAKVERVRPRRAPAPSVRPYAALSRERSNAPRASFPGLSGGSSIPRLKRGRLRRATHGASPSLKRPICRRCDERRRRRVPSAKPGSVWSGAADAHGFTLEPAGHHGSDPPKARAGHASSRMYPGRALSSAEP
jgi:hypothetical protein